MDKAGGIEYGTGLAVMNHRGELIAREFWGKGHCDVAIEAFRVIETIKATHYHCFSPLQRPAK